MQVHRWIKDMRLSCMEQNMAILDYFQEESPWLTYTDIADSGKSKKWHILQKNAYNAMHLSNLMWHQQALNINNQ